MIVNAHSMLLRYTIPRARYAEIRQGRSGRSARKSEQMERPSQTVAARLPRMCKERSVHSDRGHAESRPVEDNVVRSTSVSKEVKLCKDSTVLLGSQAALPAAGLYVEMTGLKLHSTRCCERDNAVEVP